MQTRNHKRRSRAEMLSEVLMKHCVLPAAMGVLLGAIIVAVVKFPFFTAMLAMGMWGLMKLRKEHRRKRVEDWQHAAIPSSNRGLGYALPYSQSIYSRYGSRSY